MKNSKVLKTFLIVSGLLLLFVGASTLLTPTAITAKNGIDIGGNVSLLNDIRSSGGLFLAIGMVSLLGAFMSQLTYTSIVISFTTFLAVGIARIISILLDGMPADGLVKATIVELIIGSIGVLMLLKYREEKTNLQSI